MFWQKPCSGHAGSHPAWGLSWILHSSISPHCIGHNMKSGSQCSNNEFQDVFAVCIKQHTGTFVAYHWFCAWIMDQLLCIAVERVVLDRLWPVSCPFCFHEFYFSDIDRVTLLVIPLVHTMAKEEVHTVPFTSKFCCCPCLSRSLFVFSKLVQWVLKKYHLWNRILPCTTFDHSNLAALTCFLHCHEHADFSCTQLQMGYFKPSLWGSGTKK